MESFSSSFSFSGKDPAEILGRILHGILTLGAWLKLPAIRHWSNPFARQFLENLQKFSKNSPKILERFLRDS